MFNIIVGILLILINGLNSFFLIKSKEKRVSYWITPILSLISGIFYLIVGIILI